MSKIIDKMNQAIQTGDRQTVIDVLINVCTVDPSFSSGYFEEALQHTEANFGKAKLYAEYDGGDLYEGSSDKADYGKAVIAMEDNFCEKRVKVTRALGIRLYGQVKRESNRKRKAEKSEKSVQSHVRKLRLKIQRFLKKGKTLKKRKPLNIKIHLNKKKK